MLTCKNQGEMKKFNITITLKCFIKCFYYSFTYGEAAHNADPEWADPSFNEKLFLRQMALGNTTHQHCCQCVFLRNTIRTVSQHKEERFTVGTSLSLNVHFLRFLLSEQRTPL